MIEKVWDLVGRLRQTTYTMIVFIYIPKLQFLFRYITTAKLLLSDNWKRKSLKTMGTKHTVLTSFFMTDTLPGRFK